MTVTIAQVAAVAGVSQSTVSRAFAAPDMVRAETRERVLAVGRRLGFSPSRIARSLALGKTGSIGVIVPDMSNPFFSVIAKSILAKARTKDYVAFLADNDENETEEFELAEAMTTQVDGLVLVSPRMDDDRLRDIGGRIPTVLVNRTGGDLGAVIASSEDGMRQAVEHVHALGHTHCCWVNGPRHSWSNTRRRAAVAAVCEDLGMKLTEFGPFEARFETGVHCADLVVASGATAAIAHNDMVALGLLARFADRGIGVPERISVIGVDDTLLAQTTNPPLTTVRVPLEQLGRRALDSLLALLDDPDAAATVTDLDTALTVRRSTGPSYPEREFGRPPTP